MQRRSKANAGLTNDEIGLIKTMLARGKAAGFTSQKILTYFSKPDRTVNVARIYEIRDGTRGAAVSPASDTYLDWFINRFHAGSTPDADSRPAFPWTPAPAYLGIVGERIALVPRTVIVDDPRVQLRETLLAEQCRLASLLAQEWPRFQVDQRLREHIEVYALLASEEHSRLNIFSLDTEFRTIRRSLGNETGGLGEIGEAQWDAFSRNHVVLTDLYPEMREYRAALAALAPNAALAEEEAHLAVAELLGPEGQQHVAPEVPELIQSRLGEDTASDHEAGRKRIYDVTALLNTTAARLVALIELLPKLQKGADAAGALWNRYWPLLRVVLEKAGWT